MTSHYKPRLIAWEVTRRCRLKCRHCRADASDRPYVGELSTAEVRDVLEDISSFAKPIIILTGGEPMVRGDIYEIASYGDSLGLKMVMATCGPLVTPEAVEKMKEARIRRISLSIDGATCKSHDLFRGVHGSFDGAVAAAKNALSGGLSFQINTTVTKTNIAELPQILRLAEVLGADSFHPFLLVPVGRGRDLAGLELTPREYEEVLKWIYAASKKTGMTVKPTCAPHYFRIVEEEDGSPDKSRGMDGMSRGCLGGTGFTFVSHTGEVGICGFLDVKCGNVRKKAHSFKEIWETSEVFNELRDRKNYKGKCGICEYFDCCGGCRARAYAKTGDYLASEPLCVYVPRKGPASDADILTALQDDFPIVPRPFEEISGRFGISEENLIAKVKNWKRDGMVRHISAHVDTGALGFASALVAFDAPDVAKASKAIAAHPGVSHNYERDYKYNIWFTIKVPCDVSLEDSIRKIAFDAGAADFLILPAVRMFKLDARFPSPPCLPCLQQGGQGGEGQPARHASPACLASLRAGRQGEAGGGEGELSAAGCDLTEDDHIILDRLNLGIHISPNPFREIADELNLAEKEVCRRAGLLKRRGIIRKFRAVVHHVRAGFSTNAMVVWAVPEDSVDEAGNLFAGKSFISHCYERKKYDRFPYNLYTMIHADSEDSLNTYIEGLSEESGIGRYAVLKTKMELLKRKTTILRDAYAKN